jgi:fumarate hydratase subunit alpha
MREIPVEKIADLVAGLCLKANYEIGPDIEKAVSAARETEPSPAGRAVLGQLCENYRIAREESVAICQDTGMAILFMDIGQEVHFTGGDFEEAVQDGVRRAYRDGYLRKSIVNDPVFDRKNTGDNTPAALHLRIVPGDRVHILAVAKGFGSENMSAVKMCTPAEGEAGVRDFIIDTARKAGPNPCPPMIIGVGVGGSFETAALMAKRMTARPVGSHNPDPRYAKLEADALAAINRLGIGPAGVGGKTTCLAVNIDYFPTHIAGMPVAVNICCHAARHAEGNL